MRYRKNPYEGLREYDIEHRELLARLRAAAETLKAFNMFDPRDPKFQALLPEAALNWPNRELRQAVEKAESDVEFYASFFQKKNPRKRSKVSYRKKNPRRRRNPIFSPGEQLVWEKTDPEHASYRLHNVTVVERLPDHWGEEVYKVKMGRRFAEVYGSELQRK